jgi:hypothetical protein
VSRMGLRGYEGHRMEGKRLEYLVIVRVEVAESWG